VTVTTQPDHTAPSADDAPEVPRPPAESWVAGRLFRIIAAGLGLVLLGAAFLPLITGGHEVATALVRTSDAQLILVLLAIGIVGVNVFGILRLGTPWVRSATVLLGLFVTLWALAVILESFEVGIPEPLGGAAPGVGLSIALVVGIAVIVVAALDRGTLGYADSLLDRADRLARKGHMVRPARLARTALRIALRDLGPDHEYTMFVASGYGTFLVAIGQGQRARKVSDELYPRYSALGTENTDPWFSQLRLELSRKGQ
jgi:hypothetical protein